MNAPMTAPPFPTNPAVGEYFGNWVWNGARWLCTSATGPRVMIQVFTQSGPYMPSPGLISCVVECIGGGAGGGSATSSNVAQVVSAGGGGSGSYARKVLDASIVAGGVNVTVAQQSMSNGQPTSFGALCVASGGYPATDATPGNGYNPNPGSGGTGAGSIGDVLCDGNGGHPGFAVDLASSGVQWLWASGGYPGATIGGGAWTSIAGAGGSQEGQTGGFTFGCGGSGGVVNQVAGGGSANGGMGGSGVCIVTEYCWNDGQDDCLNPPLNVNARVAVTHVPWTGPGPCPPGWGHGSGGPFLNAEGQYEGE